MPLKITEPLILSVGYHGPTGGRGCAMEALSWSMGDEQVSDNPNCSHFYLAGMVQEFNDLVGNEWGIYPVDPEGSHLWRKPDGTRILTMEATRSIELQPEHAILAFDLAWQTVGTGQVAVNAELRYSWITRVREVLGMPILLDVSQHMALEINAGRIEEAASIVSTAIAVFRQMFVPEVASITLPSAADVDAALVSMRKSVAA